jgi:hypothetical protein
MYRIILGGEKMKESRAMFEPQVKATRARARSGSHDIFRGEAVQFRLYGCSALHICVNSGSLGVTLCSAVDEARFRKYRASSRSASLWLSPEAGYLRLGDQIQIQSLNPIGDLLPREMLDRLCIPPFTHEHPSVGIAEQLDNSPCDIA